MSLISMNEASARLTEAPTACSVLEKPASLLTDHDVDGIAKRKLRSDNFRVLRWSLDTLEGANGFLGCYYTLSVTVQTGGEKTRELKFFAKTLPPSSSPQHSVVTSGNIFDKEIALYHDVLPRFGLGTGPKWIPDCYLGKNNAIIVFEDASASGYATPDKLLSFDEEQCVWTVKTLSVFHSRCLILDEKLRRDTGQTVHDLYGHLLKELMFRNDMPLQMKLLQAAMRGSSALVDISEGLTDEERRRLKDRILRWIIRLPKLVIPHTKYRNLICHRDIWANNLMFRRDSTSGRINGCYLIDYQFTSYCPPAVDFLLSLYLNTDRATRTAHFASLVDLYCDTMATELASEGLNMEECLSRAEFVQCCKEYRPTTLVASIMGLQIMLLGKETVGRYFTASGEGIESVMYGDLRREVVMEEYRSNKAYRTRLMEIIEEIKEKLPDVPKDC